MFKYRDSKTWLTFQEKSWGLWSLETKKHRIFKKNKTKAISEKIKPRDPLWKSTQYIYITLLPKHTKYLSLPSLEILILRTDSMKYLRKALGKG